MHELQEGMVKRAGHLFEAGKQMSQSEYSSAEETTDLVAGYEGVAKIQSVLADMNNQEVYQLNKLPTEKGGDPSMRVFKFSLQENATDDVYNLKVSIRPEEGSRGQARINFELSLDNLSKDSDLYRAFYQTTQYKGTEGKNARTVSGSVIRFGFDLDTKTDPATFSFDMGRDAYQGQDMERAGDVLGRILSNVAVSGHHLQDFDKSLSNPENFKKIAEAFIRHFENMNGSAKPILAEAA
jgi:hypothetical protein